MRVFDMVALRLCGGLDSCVPDKLPLAYFYRQAVRPEDVKAEVDAAGVCKESQQDDKSIGQ